MRVDVAIKFGSNEIVLYRVGIGIMNRVPTYVAVESKSGRKVYGVQAEELLRTSNTRYKIIQPIQSGKIIDSAMAIELFKYAFDICGIKTGLFYYIRANIALPCGIKYRSLDEIRHVFKMCGVDKMQFIQNGYCAREYENKWTPRQYLCVVDIGKTVTDISIVSGLEFHAGATYEIGGQQMDEALQMYINDNYFSTTTLYMAEVLKNSIASLFNRDYSTDTITVVSDGGEPKSLKISAHELRSAIECIYDQIFGIIKKFINEQGVSVIGEIHNNGILFVGGGVMLPGFYEYAKTKLDYPLLISKEPDNAVIYGLGKLLSQKASPISIKL